MSKLDINQATASNMTTYVKDYSVDTKSTDGANGTDETTWQNSNWSQQWGYFNSVPDLKTAIIMKAIWNVGKGYTCNAKTKVILDHISGWGKDTFDDILFNMEIIKRIGGDAYAEIIRDEKTGTVINLKPLDPGSIKIVVDKKGIIKRYEQTNKIPGKESIKFKPEEIFHMSHNRLADQIHGISEIDVNAKTILADEQSFDDLMKIMHRQARPMIMFKLGTDDQTVINAFATKMDQALNKGENIYIPDDENSVSYEVVQVNPSALLLDWRAETRNRFFRSIGLPQIVPGAGGQSTESESKVIYLAFEQLVEHSQRQIERQIYEQLYLKINLNPPSSLSENLQRDNEKDANNALTFQSSDTTAGVGR